MPKCPTCKKPYKRTGNLVNHWNSHETKPMLKINGKPAFKGDLRKILNEVKI